MIFSVRLATTALVLVKLNRFWVSWSWFVVYSQSRRARLHPSVRHWSGESRKPREDRVPWCQQDKRLGFNAGGARQENPEHRQSRQLGGILWLWWGHPAKSDWGLDCLLHSQPICEGDILLQSYEVAVKNDKQLRQNPHTRWSQVSKAFIANIYKNI